MNQLIKLSYCTTLTAMLLCAGLKANGADPDPKTLQESVSKGIAFLKTSQADDGSWTSPSAPGISGLALYSLLEAGVPKDDPVVQKGLKHLESHVKDDGGIYDKDTTHRNYETCIAMMVFTSANDDGKYTKLIRNAEQFLRGLQWDEGEGLETTDVNYGGAGYGGSKRPDLSNTQFLIEALKASGAKDDDPAIQKALVFVSRTQNLESEHNSLDYASKVNDGGFIYTPAAGASSKAGETDNGGLRSYASMTYAGLKSMIYAGLDKDDKRVKAAFGWIRKHYTLEENPGMQQQGLFYYYHTFAKTLAVMEIDTFEDMRGQKHNWRAELTARLANLQKSNGSWINEADRWYEGDPNLVTAYSLLALAQCGE